MRSMIDIMDVPIVMGGSDSEKLVRETSDASLR